MNIEFTSISQYVESKTSLVDKINAISALIDAMELKMLDVIGTVNYTEYNLDDGQMKVWTKYRNPNEVTSGILELEKIKQRYINRLNGRVRNLRGGAL